MSARALHGVGRFVPQVERLDQLQDLRHAKPPEEGGPMPHTR